MSSAKCTDRAGCPAEARTHTHGTAGWLDEPVTRVQYSTAPAAAEPTRSLRDWALVRLAVDSCRRGLEGRRPPPKDEALVEVGRARPAVASTAGSRTASLLRCASSCTSSAASSGRPSWASVSATAASSSTPGAIATGSMPAPRRVARRAGEVEARYRRTPRSYAPEPRRPGPELRPPRRLEGGARTAPANQCG